MPRANRPFRLLAVLLAAGVLGAGLPAVGGPVAANAVTGASDAGPGDPTSGSPTGQDQAGSGQPDAGRAGSGQSGVGPSDPGQSDPGQPDPGATSGPTTDPSATPTPSSPSTPEPTPSGTPTPTPSGTPTPGTPPSPQPSTWSAPTTLRVNGADAPLAVDPAAPVRFSWVPLAASDGSVPATYTVVVASSRAGAAAGTGDVWTSAAVTATQLVPYGGPRLAAASRYWFAVRATAPDGTVSPWSEPAVFGTVLGSWSARPIWAAAPSTTWQDYTVAGTLVTGSAVGVVFRAPDARNGYLWQFRADGTLVPHVQRSGAYTAAAAVSAGPAMAAMLRSGGSVPFTIAVSGSRIRTTVGGVVVDDRQDRTFPSGYVGLRTGRTESGSVDSLRVTDRAGARLWTATGTTSTPELRCTSLRSSRSTIATGRGCVYDPWADTTIDETFVANAHPSSVVFRARDDANGYMWQFDPARSELVPHVQVNGTYRKLRATKLGAKIVAGRSYPVRIETNGTTITTWFAGRKVDTRTDGTWARGLIGFRTGRSESVQASSLAVHSRSGRSVYAANRYTSDFSCASVTGAGATSIGTGTRCLLYSRTPDWTFARTAFSLPAGDIAWATAWATGASPSTARQYVYRLAVNGTFAAAGPVRAVGAETRYDTADVTEAVRAGTTNVLAARAWTGADHRFLAQLVVQYTDGRRVVVGTDASWRATAATTIMRPGPSVGTSYYTLPSENIDAGALPTGWDSSAFDAGAWQPAVVRPAFPAGSLVASPLAPLEETEHGVAKTLAKGSGHLVLDFGRTWVGAIRLDATASAATDVTVRYGETTAKGGVSLPSVTSAGNGWTDRYRLRSGRQTIDVWGLRVFRYVELSGLPAGVTAADVHAVALHSPIGTESSFDSSNSTLDQVWSLAAHTVEGQTLGLYTDSWERERGPYEADAYIQQLAQAALTTDTASAASTMRWLIAHPTWPTEWPLFDAIAVHDRWVETGDTGEITANYAALQRTLLTGSISSRTGLVKRTTTTGDIVDWPGAERDGYVFTTTNTVVNAITYRDLVVMSEMATAVGRTADARTYATKAASLRAAMNARLYDPTTGAYRDGLTASDGPVAHRAVQASAFALAFGVPTDAIRAKVASSVASRGMVCSVYCAAFLVPALLQNGQETAGVRLLAGTGTRSWGNMVRLGAGATMEAWDPSLKANTTYSHPWAASPTSTIATGVVGLAPRAPGWASFTVAPHPGGLTTAEIARPTARGTVRAAFRTVGASVDVAVAVPVTTTATVELPVAVTRVWVDGVARTDVLRSGGRTSVVVGQGCHTVSSVSATSATGSQVLASVCAAAVTR